MTTPAPEKTPRRRRPRRRAEPGPRPRLRLGLLGWAVSWLLPTAIMGAALLSLTLVPGLDAEGYLAPLIPLIGGAAVVVGIPGTLLIGWFYRHHLNPVIHVLGYVLVGLLHGPVVLLAGPQGLVPMLIPIVGFPAGILLGAGRWIAQPLARVEDPAAEASDVETETSAATDAETTVRGDADVRTDG